MKEKTTIELFEHYIHYWIVKLELHKKYKFVIKKDNRSSCGASVQGDINDPIKFIIKYNTKKLKLKYKIISVVLHELGHMLHDFRCTDEAWHEYTAELFSLKTAKEYYPLLYPKMIKWTKRALTTKTIDKAHKEGYIKALKELGEL